jgi:hypothetical protein
MGQVFSTGACSVFQIAPLMNPAVHDEWGKLREEALHMLSARSLEELRQQTIAKIDAIKQKNKNVGKAD